MGYRRPKKKTKSKPSQWFDDDYVRVSKGGRKVSSFGNKKKDYIPKEFNIQLIAKNYRKSLLAKRTLYEKIAEKALRDLGISYEPQKIFYYGSSFYIVDLYIKKYKLIIEIDGRHHEDEETIVKDAQRAANLRTLGIRNLLRINNRDCTSEFIKELVRVKIEEISKQ